MPHPYFDVDRPVVIGHRGAAGVCPENTLLSFERALEQGAQILESDVHVTRDGIPILLHDAEVDRVSEGHGLASSLDLDALQALDAGHRFAAPDGLTPFRGRGLRIPSLEEAFARFPDARFNLEIKCADAVAIERTLDLVARFDRADRTLVTAGEDDVMALLRGVLARHRVRPAVGACLGEVLATIASALGQGPMPEGVMALQIPPSFAGRPLVTPKLVEHAHRHDVEIHVWTVDAIEEIEALLAVGVDGIVTDFPGRMAAWLGRVPRG